MHFAWFSTADRVIALWPRAPQTPFQRRRKWGMVLNRGQWQEKENGEWPNGTLWIMTRSFLALRPSEDRNKTMNSPIKKFPNPKSRFNPERQERPPTPWTLQLFLTPRTSNRQNQGPFGGELAGGFGSDPWNPAHPGSLSDACWPAHVQVHEGLMARPHG